MKTKIKILARVLLLAGMCFFFNKASAQTTIYPTPFGIPLPVHDVIQSAKHIQTIMGGPSGTPSTSTTLNACGINTESPQFKLDVMGDADTNDINIGCALCTPVNSGGYRIGGNQVLYTDGDPTSIFVGAQAPVSPSYIFTAGLNSCLGYGVCPNLGIGHSNTLIGGYAGNHIVNGRDNTYLGDSAGFSDTNGLYNVMIGFECGASNTGTAYPEGDYNTMCGYICGFSNVHGYANSYYGKAAGYYNNGSENCMFGGHAGNGESGSMVDSNVFMGNYSASAIVKGNNNVIVGNHAGSRTGYYDSIPSYYNVFVGGYSAQLGYGGGYDITLGFGSDAYSGSTYGPVNNAVAIGANALVLNNNKFILGNNAQDVGIGMSGMSSGPSNRLEISYFSDTSASQPCSSFSSTFNDTLCNKAGNQTGASGLQFRDLTKASVPWVYDSNSGFLTVDDSGNVVLMYPPTGAEGRIGTCASPNIISAGDGGFDLATNNANFYFLGNGSSSANVQTVLIGYPCKATPTAKLNVRQASGANNTVGEYITNTDLGTGVYGSPRPIIGIVSQMPFNTSYYDVAGWFQVEHTSPSFPLNNQGYAIFVPGISDEGKYISQGTVDIGYPFATDMPDFLLDVNGYGRTLAGMIPSDSILKTNVSPFSYGLKTIRNLNPVSYQYNGIGGFETSNKYIGLIAQNLQRNEPMGVIHSTIIKDSISHDTASILNIYEEAVMYTAVNAIKQLDSAVSPKLPLILHDSVIIQQQQRTIDSLVNALQGIQTCLTTLCSNNHSPVHLNGGNGGSGDSSSAITNVQSILLSASVNAPLLYQNIPNPFSVGTKINYYLPEGTIGATLVFYDTYGNQMKTVELSQTGNGTLNITPDNLTAGIYSYSLIVNNTVIDTKRMILQK